MLLMLQWMQQIILVLNLNVVMFVYYVVFKDGRLGV